MFEMEELRSRIENEESVWNEMNEGKRPTVYTHMEMGLYLRALEWVKHTMDEISKDQSLNDDL